MTEYKKITVIIGRGTKRHPAFIVTDDRGERLSLWCRCPGTANGYARHKTRVVAEGWEAVTCGGVRKQKQSQGE